MSFDDAVSDSYTDNELSRDRLRLAWELLIEARCLNDPGYTPSEDLEYLLACYLAKVFDAQTLRVGYLGGHMVETFFINEIMKSYSNNTEEAGFYYYRDSQKHEIDLLILRDGRLSLIECKAGMTYDSTDVKAFSRLEKSDYEVGPSCIICLTDRAYPLKPGVYALPISSI